MARTKATIQGDIKSLLDKVEIMEELCRRSPIERQITGPAITSIKTEDLPRLYK